MHYPIPDIYVEFEINRPVSYTCSATAFQSVFSSFFFFLEKTTIVVVRDVCPSVCRLWK